MPTITPTLASAIRNDDVTDLDLGDEEIAAQVHGAVGGSRPQSHHGGSVTDMDHTTRNETIRALAAASAAEIRSRPARALRAHVAISGEIETRAGGMAAAEWSAHVARTIGIKDTDRELPLERTPNHYTGEHRDEVVR